MVDDNLAGGVGVRESVWEKGERRHDGGFRDVPDKLALTLRNALTTRNEPDPSRPFNCARASASAAAVSSNSVLNTKAILRQCLILVDVCHNEVLNAITL